MLTIYSVVVQVVTQLGPVVKEIERRDRDLARQMRRAMTSVPLNLSEGTYARGGNKIARYDTALGSARETRACVEVAVALGYLRPLDAALMDRLDEIAATLYRLVHRRG